MKRVWFSELNMVPLCHLRGSETSACWPLGTQSCPSRKCRCIYIYIHETYIRIYRVYEYMYIVFLDYTPISVIKLLNITYIFQWQSSKSIIIRKHSSSSSISYPFCVHPSCIIRSLFIIYTRSSADILQYHCNKNTFHFPKQKNTIPNRFFFKGK